MADNIKMHCREVEREAQTAFNWVGHVCENVNEAWMP